MQSKGSEAEMGSGKMEVTMMQCVSFAGCRFTASGRDTVGLVHILLQKTHEEKTHHSAVRRGASGGRMYLPHSLPSPVSHCHFTRVQKWRDSWARRRHRLTEEVVEGIWGGAQGLCPARSTPCATQVRACLHWYLLSHCNGGTTTL